MTEFSKRIRPMFFNHVSVGLLPLNILLLLDFQPGNGSFTMGGFCSYLLGPLWIKDVIIIVFAVNL